jgi:hypothetical protein
MAAAVRRRAAAREHVRLVAMHGRTRRGLDTAARLARDDVNTGCVVVSPAEPILLLLHRAPVHFRRANLYGKHQRNCEPLGERRRMSS